MERLYSKEFQKYFEKQEKATQIRIWKAITRLPEGDVRKVYSPLSPFLHRLRVGKFRILFLLKETHIHILTMNTRGDVYKLV